MKESILSALAISNAEENGYLVTTGRKTGLPREIEIWYVSDGSRIYMVSDHLNKDWIKNIRANPNVRFRIADQWFEGQARLLEFGTEEDLAVRRIVSLKYHNKPFEELNETDKYPDWNRTGPIVGIDVG
jgi:deazaflavin-dependent oxidoreductase (nitroreductase family)